jgi:hypothetical protein
MNNFGIAHRTACARNLDKARQRASPVKVIPALQFFYRDVPLGYGFRITLM